MLESIQTMTEAIEQKNENILNIVKVIYFSHVKGRKCQSPQDGHK